MLIADLTSQSKKMTMMDSYRAIEQQNAMASVEELRRDTVICPKPLRLGLLNTTMNNNVFRSLWLHHGCNADICDTNSGVDPFDIILTKGGDCTEPSCIQVASSPPFFCGSPPSRVSNPLIQDARFENEKVTPSTPLSFVTVPSGMSSSPSSARKGGRNRTNFGNNPAVRIEGFDCRDRDRRNCSIPALA